MSNSSIFQFISLQPIKKIWLSLTRKDFEGVIRHPAHEIVIQHCDKCGAQLYNIKQIDLQVQTHTHNIPINNFAWKGKFPVQKQQRHVYGSKIGVHISYFT